MLASMSQIYLFTGENSFTLRERKRIWVGEFVHKHGEENFSALRAKEVKFRSLLDEIAVAPFIAEKRLVLIDGIPKCEKGEIEQLPIIMHEDVVLLFIEPKLDKRLSATKEILKIATVEEYKPLSGSALHQWIDQYLRTMDASIGREAHTHLVDIVGEQQDLLSQELKKLSLYVSGREIGVQDIDDIVLCSGERQVWGLMDLVGQGKEDEALAYVQRLLQQGESVHGLWNIFLWMMSGLAPVASAVEEGISNPARITKECGVSFGSARSLLPLARRLKKKRIQEIIDRVVGYDIALKTGAYRATDQAPQELRAILDRSIIECCRG